MAMNTRLVDNMAFEVSTVPIDTTGAAQAGDYFSLKYYNHITFIIAQGAWAGTSVAVTLKQATNVTNSLSDEKALSFSERWSKVALTGTVWTRTAVTSDTFNLGAVANTIHAIEVDAATLDVTNNFDCVRLNIAAVSSAASLICVVAILSNARYPQQAITMIDAKVN